MQFDNVRKIARFITCITEPQKKLRNPKKNRLKRQSCKSWLAAIEQLRTTYRLDVLSLNESIQKIKSTNILQ